jgi:endonuclease/exonuclease/phosphatase family metal-dependent hydrolase
VASSTKSKEEKPRKRRRADSASLLTWPGMVLVVLGELAVRVSPSWFPWLAPFGLAYGLGWVLLASGVLWRVVSFRWIRAAFPAIVLIATWPSFMLVFSLGLGTADMPEPTVESEASWGVMSFNVRRLDEYSWLVGDATRRELAEWLGNCDEAVWCFQEFPRDGKSVLREAGFSWNAPRRRLLTWPNGAGPALATTFGVQDWTTWMFPEEAGRGRVLQADLKTPSGTVRVFNVHLQSLYFSREDYAAVEEGPSREEGLRLLGLVTRASQARAAQARILQERMEESPYPVVLAGDFNDSPMSYAVRRLRKGRARDTFEASGVGLGSTHIGKVPGLRIDGILADTTLAVWRQETHGVELSDHRPVTAVLSVKR